MGRLRLALAAVIALALPAHPLTARGAAPAPAPAPAPVKEVAVVGPRVSLADVVPSAPAAVASADVGPAPAPGGSRMLTQDDLRKAATAAGASPGVLAALPTAVRLVRKMRRLTAEDIERETRKAVAAASLRRGVTLAAVRAPRSADVAEGWTAVTAEVPRPPRRTGRLPTTAALTFTRGAEVIARLAVPIDLDLGAEAALPDVAKGAALTVTVTSGLVEISAAALAGADADVGDELLVTLRPSGKVLRARLTAKDRAVVAAGPAPAAASTTPVAPAPAAPPVTSPAARTE